MTVIPMLIRTNIPIHRYAREEIDLGLSSLNVNTYRNKRRGKILLVNILVLCFFSLYFIGSFIM